MINIAKLLEDAPKGMKLYSPLFGEVKFKYINGSKFGIVVEDSEERCRSFDKYGRYFTLYDNAECLLFPSKDCRTWEGWKPSVEPLFKVGDWLVYKDGATFCGGLKTVQVQTIEKDRYIFTHGTNSNHHFIDSECRLWAIADAHDGDVLATDNIICIFRKLDKDGYYIISPCIYTVKNGLEVIDDENDSIGSCGFKPASKEDRELLFRKMKEAGYTWNEKKKELHKIQPHYDIKNFKPFDKVLVRDYNDSTWKTGFYSHRTKDNWFACAGSIYKQCIPFNEETKHLLGTTDPCDERFTNW